ncbi:hypothetical protein [Halalkalibacter alkalisediminis]|nr:hypothetical protein [Halalkalibacter alkalisediminis]
MLTDHLIDNFERIQFAIQHLGEDRFAAYDQFLTAAIPYLLKEKTRTG